MLFGRKKSAETIFTGHYKTMLEIAKASAIAQNPEFELLIMYNNLRKLKKA